MSRPIKGKAEVEQLACWIPADTMKRLDDYVKRSTLSKRDITAAALDAFFDRLEDLEKPRNAKESAQ